MYGYKMVIPDGNEQTFETINRKVVPHLEQLGIFVNISEDLSIIFPRGILSHNFALMEKSLTQNYGIGIEEKETY